MSVKKLFNKLHLWLGLTSGLVVFIVALTGSILVFEKELDEWFNDDFYFVSVTPGAQRLPVDHLLHNAQAYRPDMTIRQIEISQESNDRAFLFRAQKGKQNYIISVNPYSGAVIKMINRDKRFFTVVLQLHRYLLAGKVGKAITGVSCIIFLVLIITGLVLWWPKRRRMLKERLKIKWNASRKRLNWDLHSVSGFYVHIIIFMIAFTGLTWSYKWFNNGIFLLFDGKPQQKYSAPANTVNEPVSYGFYEQLYREANRQLAYTGELRIAIPENDSLSITISKENLDASISNVVDFLYYEKGTGRLLKERLYKNESSGMKARRLVYPIHTGQIYGLPTKILAFIATLVVASLPITGVFIWLGRKKKNKKATHAMKKGVPVSRQLTAVAELQLN